MKKAFLWLKNQYLPPNLAIFISKLKYFLRNSTIFKTQDKNSRKIENSRLKLNDFDQKTQGTGGFYHMNPLKNRTKINPALMAKRYALLYIPTWSNFKSITFLKIK